MAKPMEGVKNLDNSTQESFGVRGMVCIYSSLWNWGDPTFHVNSVKDKYISAKHEIVCRKEGVGGGNNTNDKQDNRTCFREGPLLCSSFMKEVRVNECR